MTAKTPPRLAVRDLTKRLPSGGRDLTILDNVSFAVEPGERVAILGPSGSGKSTLLALLAGLDHPSSGEVRLDGVPIHDLSEDALALLRRHTVGFVFQSFQLLGNYTARENVLLPLELIGDPDPGARADELLALVGLAARGHHYPVQLSGGEQQRVALARAFASRPSVLFADEPTGNLDQATGAAVLAALVDLERRHGTTLILVTHDPSVAAIADRRIHLRDGRIERDERSPQRPAVLEPLATAERPTVAAADDTAVAGLADPPAADGQLAGELVLAGADDAR